jgi:serralysin
MADYFITTNVSGTNLNYTMVTGDIFVLQAGVSITGDGYSYIYGVVEGVTASIDGNVWLEGATGTSGSPFYFNGQDTITIGRNATMTLLSGTSTGVSGIMLGTGGYDGTSFSNHGHIVTMQGEGMSVRSSFNVIVNTGTIDLTTGRMSFFAGSGNVLDNSGTIIGSGRFSFGALIDFSSSNMTFRNSGEVSVSRPGLDTVRDTNTSGDTIISNSGEITSVHGQAIVTSGSHVQLINTGTITGGNGALNLGGGNNTVTNTGAIIGKIIFGAGTDTFRGIGGTVAGTIAGGAGGDTYYTSDAGMQIIELAAGGNDKVFSTVDFRLAAQIETLVLQGAAVRGVGNTSNNTITGNGADNRLFGLFGLDNILGGEGDDLIFGGDGNDTLQGQDGDDLLRGGLGNDSLTGLQDSDRLLGEAGADNLRGGTGNDEFVFTRVSDSGITVLTSDLIADFVRGQDVIDLQAIDANTVNAGGNDAFVFIGLAAFTGVAGQLRYVSAAGVTTLLMDVNGNGVADMSVRLTGTLPLTASDFIL